MACTFSITKRCLRFSFQRTELNLLPLPLNNSKTTQFPVHSIAQPHTGVGCFLLMRPPRHEIVTSRERSLPTSIEVESRAQEYSIKLLALFYFSRWWRRWCSLLKLANSHSHHSKRTLESSCLFLFCSPAISITCRHTSFSYHPQFALCI